MELDLTALEDMDGLEALSAYTKWKDAKDKEYEEDKKNRPSVFELKAIHVQEADVTFITGKPKMIPMHGNLSIGTKKFQKRRCQGEGCPHCMNENKAGPRFVYLVVDHRAGGYVDNNGKQVDTQHQLRWLALNGSDAGTLNRIKDKLKIKDLAGQVVNLSKSDKQASIAFAFIPKDEDLHVVPKNLETPDWDVIFPQDNKEATKEVITGKPRFGG